MHDEISNFWEWLEENGDPSSIPEKVERVAYRVCRQASQEKDNVLFNDFLDFVDTYPDRCKHLEYDKEQARQKAAERITGAWSDLAQYHSLEDATEQRLLKIFKSGALETESIQYHVHSIARTYYRASEYEKCIEYFNLLEDVSDIDACRNWADACKKLDKKEEALQPYARALEILPNSPEWLVNYARCLFDLGRITEAEPYINNAIKYGEMEKYRYSANYLNAINLKAIYLREKKEFLKEYFQYARMLSGASERADALAMEYGAYILERVEP